MSPSRDSSYSPTGSAFGDFRERRGSCMEPEFTPIPWALSFEPQSLPPPSPYPRGARPTVGFTHLTLFPQESPLFPFPVWSLCQRSHLRTQPSSQGSPAPLLCRALAWDSGARKRAEAPVVWKRQESVHHFPWLLGRLATSTLMPAKLETWPSGSRV